VARPVHWLTLEALGYVLLARSVAYHEYMHGIYSCMIKQSASASASAAGLLQSFGVSIPSTILATPTFGRIVAIPHLRMKCHITSPILTFRYY
jgi:hypothetical protein